MYTPPKLSLPTSDAPLTNQNFFLVIVYTNSLLATLNARKLLRPVSIGGGGGGGNRMVVDATLSLRNLPTSPISPEVKKNFHSTSFVLFPLFFFHVLPCSFLTKQFFFSSNIIASKYIDQNWYHPRIAWRESSWWRRFQVQGEYTSIYICHFINELVCYLGRIGLIF